MKSAMNQLEKWILDYEKVNGTPTMCEIKAQLEMFKEVEKQQIKQAYKDGIIQKAEGANQYFDCTFGDNTEARI